MYHRVCALERKVASSNLIPKYCATAVLSSCSLCRKRATSSGVSFRRDLLIRYLIPCSGAEGDASWVVSCGHRMTSLHQVWWEYPVETTCEGVTRWSANKDQ